MKKYLWLLSLLIATPIAVQAACPTGTSAVNGICVPTKQTTGLDNRSVENVVINVTQVVTGIIGVLAILMIVVSGVMYITSGGDQNRVDTAKRMLTYSIVGLVVALLAFTIVSTISGALT